MSTRYERVYCHSYCLLIITNILPNLNSSFMRSSQLLFNRKNIVTAAPVLTDSTLRDTREGDQGHPMVSVIIGAEIVLVAAAH